jgi:hypothetical protein
MTSASRGATTGASSPGGSSTALLRPRPSASSSNCARGTVVSAHDPSDSGVFRFAAHTIPSGGCGPCNSVTRTSPRASSGTSAGLLVSLNCPRSPA